MSSALGIIGMGVMGHNLARNFARHGFSLSLFNQRVEKKEEEVANRIIRQFPELQQAQGFEYLSPFVESLQVPRIIICMIPAGLPVDQLIGKISPLLTPGDVLIDGGNSHYKDTERRQQQLSTQGIHCLGAGVSGGEEGALHGPSIMVGGEEAGYDKVRNFLEQIAALDNKGGACCARVGHGGAGHFVKMVHNGIEYAEMQLLAEVYGVLRWGQRLSPDEIANLFERWIQTEVNSYLLSISKDILRKKEGAGWLIDSILDTAENKGTGGWTTIAAAELGVPIPTIAEALFARYSSSFKNLRMELNQKSIISTVNFSVEDLWKAYRLGRISNHQQGFHLIEAASRQLKWDIHLPTLTRIWTNGCIIRSSLMNELEEVFQQVGYLLQDGAIQSLIKTDGPVSFGVTGKLISHNLPVPALASAMVYLQTMLRGNGNGNFIQAQRDYFGAHGYQRVDDPERKKNHTHWK